MTRQLAIAVLQLALALEEEADNIAAVSALVEQAAGEGAQVILPPELFEGEYFCRVEDEGLFANAAPVTEHKAVLAMQALAEALRKLLDDEGERFHLGTAALKRAASLPTAADVTDAVEEVYRRVVGG